MLPSRLTSPHSFPTLAAHRLNSEQLPSVTDFAFPFPPISGAHKTPEETVRHRGRTAVQFEPEPDALPFLGGIRHH
jgi:hypothetical protein